MQSALWGKRSKSLEICAYSCSVDQYLRSKFSRGKKMVRTETCSASVCFLLVTKMRAQGDLSCCRLCINESHPHSTPWKLSVHWFSALRTPDFIGQWKYCTDLIMADQQYFSIGQGCSNSNIYV